MQVPFKLTKLTNTSPVWAVVSCSLVLITGSGVFGMTPAPDPRPSMDVLQAVRLATEFANRAKDLSKFYLSRAWLSREDDPKNWKWVVFWSPSVTNKGDNKWFMVSVEKDGTVQIQVDSPTWFGTATPDFEPKPKINAQRAVRLASKFLAARKNLSLYYIDRVWLERIDGDDNVKWVVSWSPDGSQQGGAGWPKVSVDMNSNVADLKIPVKWFLPQEPKPRSRVYTP